MSDPCSRYAGPFFVPQCFRPGAKPPDEMASLDNEIERLSALGHSPKKIAYDLGEPVSRIYSRIDRLRQLKRLRQEGGS